MFLRSLTNSPIIFLSRRGFSLSHLATSLLSMGVARRFFSCRNCIPFFGFWLNCSVPVIRSCRRHSDNYSLKCISYFRLFLAFEPKTKQKKDQPQHDQVYCTNTGKRLMKDRKPAFITRFHHQIVVDRASISCHLRKALTFNQAISSATPNASPALICKQRRKAPAVWQDQPYPVTTAALFYCPLLAPLATGSHNYLIIRRQAARILSTYSAGARKKCCKS